MMNLFDDNLEVNWLITNLSLPVTRDEGASDKKNAK